MVDTDRLSSVHLTTSVARSRAWTQTITIALVALKHCIDLGKWASSCEELGSGVALVFRRTGPHNAGDVRQMKPALA
jgi:hypothetical protein